MHDFHLADTIHRTILEYAAKNNLKKITRVVIELGSIIEHGEEILPENLKFNLRLLFQGTMADSLEVAIEPVRADNWMLKEIEGE